MTPSLEGPRFGRLLALLLPRADREVIVGDLEERHAERVRLRGRGAADRRYVIDVARSLWARGPARWFGGLGGSGMRDGSDLVPVLRRIFRQPVAAAVIVLSLAGGIGIASATLVLREAVFVRPPPLLSEPEQLSEVNVGTPERMRGLVPFGLYDAWARDLPAGASVAAAGAISAIEARTADRTSVVSVRAVTPGFFGVLGVQPALGALPLGEAPRDSERDGGVVLSHELWLRLFDGRTDAIGQTLRVGDDVETVIGVLPERFWFEFMDPMVWRTLPMSSTAPDQSLAMIVRRPDGLTAEALRAHLQGGLDRWVAQLPEAERSQRAQVWRVGGTPIARQVALVVPWILGAAVFLTLIIACANAAVLIFAQWTARERELALRASLGASRGRLVRQLLVEALALATIGGALGLAATVVLTRVVARAGGPVLTLIDLSMDPAIYAKSVLVTLFAGVLTGLGPALVETARAQGNLLRAFAAERVRQRWRNGLVTLEIALTVALLIVAGSLVDAYRRAFSANLGYDSSALLIARLENPEGVPLDRVRAALNSTPGVVNVAAASSVPLAGGGSDAPVTGDASGSNAVSAQLANVDAGLFATLGVGMTAGRGFTEAEAGAGGSIAILNDSLAARIFPDSSPIGGMVWVSGEAHEVVGVVANYSNVGIARVRPGVFLPLAGDATERTRVQLLIRTGADTADLGPAVRRAVADAAPGTTVTSLFAPRDLIAQGAREILATTVPLLPLILMGLLLTAAGIYGVLAFAIARRSRELATRVAMGAGGRQLMRLIAAQSLRLLATGSALAVAATYGLTRLVRAAGGGGSAFDTPSWEAFVIPVAIVLGVGLLASWLPARRTLSIDPAVVLKGE